MTQTSNRLMDEFAKLMSDAAGLAQGAKREAETAFRHQFERFIGEMNLVQRDEVDAVAEMAARARQENDALKAQIADLEARVAKLETKPRKAPAKRTTKKAS
jgi:BMFP domain-containing protein YqiC